jgi:peptidoglycan/xylan/chitin deacetylase (PgdA/CDA1 family)
MAQDGITFGAHGETHRRLTTLPVDEAQREIKASREMLERTLGDRVTLFSYPNGDWNAGVAHKVAKERFSMAFSTGPGWIDSKSNRFALSRINVHEDMTHTTPMFLARLIGIV